MTNWIEYRNLIGVIAAGALFFTIRSLLKRYFFNKLTKEKELRDHRLIHRFDGLRLMPEEKALEQGIFCLICFNNPSNVIVQPCYHLALCSQCFPMYCDRMATPECPCCRQKIEKE
jgi:hypothetical protein